MIKAGPNEKIYHAAKLATYRAFARDRRRARYGCSENKLIFDAAWLDGAPQLGNAITYLEIVKLCDELLEALQLRIGLAGLESDG
jgi:hypothetical protein